MSKSPNTTARSKLPPVHPGELLKETLDDLGISMNRMAQEIKSPPIGSAALSPAAAQPFDLQVSHLDVLLLSTNRPGSSHTARGATPVFRYARCFRQPSFCCGAVSGPRVALCRCRSSISYDAHYEAE